MSSESGESVRSDKARCRHCADAIYRRSDSADSWKHSLTGKTSCRDLFGHDRRARPTRQWEERNAED